MRTNEMARGVDEGAPLRRDGAGWRRDEGGLTVLHVAGDFREMGRQHGALLRDEVHGGPMLYFREVVQRLVGAGRLGPVAPHLVSAMQRTVGRRVAGAMPPFALETLEGLAEGSGLPFDRLLEGATMPDALLWVTSRLIEMKRVGPAVAHRIALGLGCTSALAWGDATVDGRLLHARNFDYHGVGTWPSRQALIFHEPDHGQAYVSISAAGVPLGGVTAMNEAGLTLTVHQHMFTDRAALGGTPIGVAGDVVMREARDLDDAERILREHRAIGCWTYLIADGKTNEVLCFEESPELQVAKRVRAPETSFGYANVYLDDRLGRTERYLYGSYWRHNLGRHQRVRAGLAAREGQLDPRSIAELLGDRGDPRCRVRDSIAMVMTVASVVFRPDDGTVWVADGEAPTSHGMFRAFSLEDELHGSDELSFALDVDPRERDGFEHFRRAFVAYQDDADVEAALAHADRAREVAPEQSLYHALAGLFAICRADAEGAERRLNRALSLGHPDPERVAAMHLWRARARDLAGQRDSALRDYRAALGHPADPPVWRAARRGLKRPFKSAAAKRVHVDVGLADVVSP